MKTTKEFKTFLDDLDRQTREIAETRKAVEADFIDAVKIKKGDNVRVYYDQPKRDPRSSLKHLGLEEVSIDVFVRLVYVNSKNEIDIVYNKSKKDGTESKIRQWIYRAKRIELLTKNQ